MHTAILLQARGPHQLHAFGFYVQPSTGRHHSGYAAINTLLPALRMRVSFVTSCCKSSHPMLYFYQAPAESTTLLKPALLFSCTLALGFTAQADELVMPATAPQASAPASLPVKGQSMKQVLKHYGEPQQKHAPVGGDAPKHPPITRWDYPGFSVFFEHSHVVDAVVPGRPPQVYHAEQLQPATHQ